MNPFDQPPTTPPVVLDPQPTASPKGSGGRGRMALVAFTAAGLVGATAIGVSTFASADSPSTSAPATTVPDEPDDTTPPTDPDEDGRDPADPDDPGDPRDLGPEGEIIIDLGDGDPIVIHLDDMSIGEGTLRQLHECIGAPFGEFRDFGEFNLDGTAFDELFENFDPEDLPFGDFEAMLEDLPFDIGELEDLGGMFGPDGTHVTVFGPDGGSVIEFGEGDGSVTITRENGEITIETDGDASESELPGFLAEFDGEMHGRVAIDDGDLQEFFDSLELDDEWLAELLDEGLGAFPMLDIEPLDGEELQSCVNEALGR